MVKALLESYRIWEPRFRFGRHDTESESSVLYDALAVALAYRPELCAIEELRLEVTADGFTRRAADGGPVRAALSWPQEGRAAFERFLVDRLLAFR